MGKFTVQQFRSGSRFSLKAGNGQIIAASPIYCTKEACLAGVRAVQRLASSPVEDLSSPRTAEPGTGPRYQIYEDKGSVCFRLLDEQGAPLLFSEGYTAKRSCRMGIQSVGLNAPGAPVLVG